LPFCPAEERENKPGHRGKKRGFVPGFDGKKQRRTRAWMCFQVKKVARYPRP
jgi:hypothetical protein